MNIKDIQCKRSKTIRCLYNNFNRIELFINTRIYFSSFSSDNILLSFDYHDSNTNKNAQLEFRSSKMSFLRKASDIKIDFDNFESNDINSNYMGTLELKFENDDDFIFIKNTINNNKYLSYIEEYDNNYLYVVVKEYDNVKDMKLTFYYEKRDESNGKSKTSKLKDKYLLNSNFNNKCCILLAMHNENNSIYIVGSNKYLAVDNNDGFLYIKNKENYDLSEDINNFSYTLYFGEHNFYNSLSNNNIQNKQNKIFFEQKNINQYLDIWKKYEKLSIKYIVDSFINTKFLKYDGYKEEKNLIKFTLDDLSNISNFIEVTSENNVSELMISNINVYDIIIKKLQEYKSNNDNTTQFDQLELIDETIKKVRQDNTIISLNYTKKLKKDSVSISFEIDNNNNNNFSKEGYIFYSISGDYAMHKRRCSALNNINNNTAGMPYLYKILQDDHSYKAKTRANYIPPITYNLINTKFKKTAPTSNQEKAIEIALNTPDIALIQGPPGTGKTTVISAILFRLSEIAGKDTRYFGNELISAYQHDAVQNVLTKTNNFGFPIIEIGDKSGGNLDMPTVSWIKDTKEKFENKFPEIIKKSKIKNIDDEIISIIASNYIQINTCINFLDKLLDELKEYHLDIDIENKISIFLNKIRENKFINDNKEILNLLYKIPTNEISYEDGGNDILTNIVFYLKINNIEPKIIEFFENFIIKPSNFNQLKNIKNSLLFKFLIKSSIFLTKKDKDELDSILNEILIKIKNEQSKNISNLDNILLSYYNSLINENHNIKNSISNYYFTVGATNQKSDSNAVWKNRISNNLKNKSDIKYYKNILLDEAARSNPLDLMIPMSLAKDRIIIVGDHRQLPHIIEENILDEEEGVKKEDIETSIFEYLFGIIKDLEKRDGIKRTITLDKQYRTHPVLGKFISRVFYEKNGDPKIDSPRNRNDFSHKLFGLENKACVWIDVNQKKHGYENKIATGGYIRNKEAEIITKHIKKILDTEEGKKYTYGIITFYKKQVEQIKKLLSKEGIFNSDGSIKEEYKKNEILVGSVDAFQGREFDVVYLSTVRSNYNKNNDSRKFGFLELENRLCVSMSRQKRILISVGDLSMFDNELAKEKVNGLYEFIKICREENDGVIIDADKLL